MPNVTLFAAPKPFVGHVGTIQLNAVRSWGRLEPAVQIVLLGDEAGTADAAHEVGALHVPGIERNDFGTPQVDSLFREAHRAAGGGGMLAYVNADIILLDDFLASLARVELPRFLLAGRRRNIELGDELRFGPGWEVELLQRVRRGRPEKPWGSDYFVFRADGSFKVVPPFALGRARWDNWLIAKARRCGIPVIDATRAITAVHQVHGHGHIAGHTGVEWGGPESDENAAMLRASIPGDVVFHLWDATHVFGARGVRRTIRPVSLWRRWRTRHALPHTPA